MARSYTAKRETAQWVGAALDRSYFQLIAMIIVAWTTGTDQWGTAWLVWVGLAAGNFLYGALHRRRS